MLSADRRREDRGPGRRRSFALTALALVAMASWSVPAAEAAQKPLYKGTFKANLSGSYQVDWSLDRRDCVGSGVERVTFSTPTPLQLGLSMNRPNSAPQVVFASTGDSTMYVAATLERSANMVTSAGCPELQSCAASAQLEWWLELLSVKRYAGPGRTHLTLDAHKTREVAEPLPHCPLPGEDYYEAPSFPELSNAGGEAGINDDIVAYLHGFKLFKPDVKRFKFSASGSHGVTGSDGESGYVTALDFTLALKRTSK